MNTAELRQLADWLEAEVKQSGILEGYVALHSLLSTNAQPNQKKQPCEEHRDKLLDKLKVTPLHELSLDQIKYLDMLEVSQFLGQQGVRFVEDTLYRNVLDIATAVSKFQDVVTALQLALARIDPIRKALDGCESETMSHDSAILMRVGFTGDASITNVVDLKKWAAIWHEIGRGIAMYHGGAPEDIHIVGAGKGSVILELAVGLAIARTVATVLRFSLEVTERVYEIRIKAEELRGLKISNSTLESLEQDALHARNEGEAELIEVLGQARIEDSENDGDVGNALRRAVKSLLDFLEKGGEVDCIVPADLDDLESAESDTSYSELLELRERLSEIKILESKIRLLGIGKPDAREGGE